MRKGLLSLGVLLVLQSPAAFSTPVTELEGAALKVEYRLDVPKGATGLLFANDQVTPDFNFTSACASHENVCILALDKVASQRKRYLDSNTRLTVKSVAPSFCSDKEGVAVELATSRYVFQLRCRLVPGEEKLESLQKALSRYLTVQFPAKID